MTEKRLLYPIRSQDISFFDEKFHLLHPFASSNLGPTV
jgi:hypothetical protein